MQRIWPPKDGQKFIRRGIVASSQLMNFLRVVGALRRQSTLCCFLRRETNTPFFSHLPEDIRSCTTAFRFRAYLDWAKKEGTMQ